MRHLLALLTVLAVTSISYSQARVYDVTRRDLGGGYSIAEGSTITVVDGEFADWMIAVDGRYPFTFTSPGALVSFDDAIIFSTFKDAIITDSTISVELGTPDAFGVGFFTDYFAGCEAELYCEARLDWTHVFETAEPLLQFTHTGFIPNGEFHVTQFADVAKLTLLRGEVVIATVLPEPSGFTLLLVGLGIAIVSRDYLTRRRDGIPCKRSSRTPSVRGRREWMRSGSVGMRNA